MKESRVKIIDTFHKLPKIIKAAGDRMEEDPDDELLFDEVNKLCLKVLQTIEGMLKWLTDTSTCR